MSEPHIRAATNDDLGQMLVLWRVLEAEQGPFRVFPVVDDPETRVRAMFGAALDAEDTGVFVVEDAGTLVAMALTRIAPGHGVHDVTTVELSRVVVVPGHRGRGIAAALIAAADAFGRAHGASYVAVKTFIGNDAGRRFWERMGFAPRYEERVRPILPAEDGG